jgi:hypothetical protein
MNALMDAIREHWFWAAMTAAVVVWYSTITLYVAIRGTMDIRGMLQRLKDSNESSLSESDNQGQA